MQFYSKIVLLFIAAVLVYRVQCRTTGPPADEPANRDRVCNDMLPNHSSFTAQGGNGGYTITTDLPQISNTEYAYTAGQTYNLTLSGGQVFQGFLVIGHVPGQPLVVLGAFATGGPNQQIIEECDNMGVNMQAAIGHMGGVNAASTMFSWTAPSDGNGTVDFRFTVVQAFATFFVAQSAAQTSPQPPVPPTLPERDPEDYRLIFRTPANCLLDECNVFVGIDTNNGSSEYLDITMQGVAGGWLAVGFSSTANMFDADVVGCIRDPNTNEVTAIDTWNSVAEPRTNTRDDTQDIILFNSSFINSTISCTFSRLITGSDPTPQDRNLDNNYFILYGYRGADNPNNDTMSFPVHDVTPVSSPMMINPVNPLINEVTTPNRAPLDYRLRIRDPPGCDPSECDLYVGIDTNTGDAEFLDIYIEGDAQGWVAVGFSDTRDMFAADVVGCNRDTNTNMVAVVDTWNPDDVRFNTLDATQDVVLFNSDFMSGRITCTFAKRIAATDANQDLNLNADLFIMYGIGPNGGGVQALSSHVQGAAGNPLLSADRVNPVAFSGDLGEDFPMVQLLRAHGILMLIAWPLLAISGIFFAAWMRPALPNGEWFQIHRAFLLSSLFVGAIGFMLAFVAHARNPTPGLINFAGNPTGTAHYAIGLLVMLLHIINPIISACRCHPGEKYRWVFNLIHGTTIGLLVEVLALTNIALGLERFGPSSFFTDSNPLTIFWVYIGFLIFFLIVIGVLFLVFTLLSLFSQDEDRSKTAPSLIKPLIGSGPDPMHKPVPSNEGVELAVPGQKPTVASGDDSEKPKVPSKDAPLRWGALTIFLVVNVIMMLVLIILIAIE